MCEINFKIIRDTDLNIDDKKVEGKKFSFYKYLQVPQSIFRTQF